MGAPSRKPRQLDMFPGGKQPQSRRPLSAAFVASVKADGVYFDGAGLYLQVRGGSKSWLYKFQLRGRARAMGLGSCVFVTLGQAREAAFEARRQVHAGIDPIQAREAERAANAAASARRVVFRDAAQRYIDSHQDGWKNAKHRAQWPATLETYAYPVIGDVNVAEIDTGMVMKILEPIWKTRPETASRVRGRMESILDWAKVNGYRDGENPARWRGHLDKLLPPRTRIAKVRHHPALPFAEISTFITELHEQDGTASLALEFVILTAVRTGEAIGARWSEFNLDAAEWTIPADRMKAGKEHRVPLSPRAVQILRKLPRDRSGYVFLGGRDGRPLSNMAMLQLLKRMKRSDLTVHGFRSGFRDWASETTNYPKDVVEMALAHAVENKVEGAYRRGDLLARRRRLMDAWAAYCARPAAPAGNVTKIGSRQNGAA